MNILLVDVLPSVARALAKAGHTVRELRPGGGVFYLPALLKASGFSPDLAIQQERLGPRCYLGGWDHLSCPAVFWALDSHLNLFWQQWYGLLFDAVATPHVSLFSSLPEWTRPGVLQRLAWPGEKRAWKPHRERAHFMSLCARLSPHRPLRTWFVELLAHRGLCHAQDLNHADMMRLYDASRIVPNECIANETNFRLLEAASSGCLVLSPDVGEDQNALLTPGKECLVYHDGRELLDQTAWLRGRAETAERLGLAALERVQAEHLPERRAQTLLDLAARLTSRRLSGTPASLALWLALSVQIRNKTLPLDPAAHAGEGLRLARRLPDRRSLPLAVRPLLSHALAECLCLLAEDQAGALSAEHSGTAKALDLCRRLLTPDASGPGRGHGQTVSGYADWDCPALAATPELSSTASALALREGDLSLALACWRRYAGRAAADAAPDDPADAFALCERWSDALREERRRFLPGFQFKAETGMLPQSDLTWLYFADRLAPDKAPALYPRLESLLADRPDLRYPYLECLERHLLLEPENWRLQREYGRICLKACRVEEGVYQLQKAREKEEADRDANPRGRTR